MSNHKIKKNTRKSLYSLDTNILKHKQTSQSQNYTNKENRIIPASGSLLTPEELHQIRVKYYTHGHFRDESGEVMSKKSKNKSKNANKTDKNFTTENNQSIRIVSTNTWNWAQVTEINQSNKSWDEINQINIENDTSDMNDFAEVFINQKWLQEKNTSNLSCTDLNGSEIFNNNDLIPDSCSEVLELDQHKSVNNQFNQDDYKENFDSNIFSDFEYINHYSQHNHGVGDNHNISQEINLYQNSDQTMNSNYWCNDNRNNVVQSLKEECYNFDRLDYTIYDDRDALNSSSDSFLEYFSL